MAHSMDKRFVLFRFDIVTEQFLVFGAYDDFQSCIDAAISDKNKSTCYKVLPIDKNALVSFTYVDNKFIIG